MAPEALTNADRTGKPRDRARTMSALGPHAVVSPCSVFRGLEPHQSTCPRLPQPQEVDSGGPPCAPVTYVWSWDSTQTRVEKVGEGEPALVSHKHVTLCPLLSWGAPRQQAQVGVSFPLPGGPETAGLRWEVASPFLGAPR